MPGPSWGIRLRRLVVPDDQGLRLSARKPWSGLRYALGAGVALAVGTHLGGTLTGIAAASGAINAAGVGLADGLRRPRAVMWVSTLVLALAAFLGSITSPQPVLSAAVLVVIGTLAGLFAPRGPAAQNVGIKALIGFATMGSFPPEPREAATLCLAVVAGGALEVLIGVAARSRPARWVGGHVRPVEPFTIDPGPRRSVRRDLADALRDLFRRPDATARWHAARMGAALLAATAIGTQLPGPHGYWVSLTVITVLRPDWVSTASRGVDRWIGTLVGAVLGAAVFSVVHPEGPWLVVVVTLATWGILSLQSVNYALYCTVLTVWIVVFVQLSGIGTVGSALDRAVDTTIGGLLCLAAHLVTWRHEGT